MRAVGVSATSRSRRTRTRNLKSASSAAAPAATAMAGEEGKGAALNRRTPPLGRRPPSPRPGSAAAAPAGERAGAHDALERSALVLHVLLADLDELRQLIVPLHQQHVDVGPGELHRRAHAYQAVVDRD